MERWKRRQGVRKDNWQQVKQGYRGELKKRIKKEKIGKQKQKSKKTEQEDKIS